MSNANGFAAGPASLEADEPEAGAGASKPTPLPEQTMANKTVAAVIGEIVWLMSQSPEYKQYLISDLEWLVMPPVLLRQFRIFYQGDVPAAAVLYAFVSEAVETRLEAGAPTLRVDDWKSGKHPRIIRTIAPFGGTQDFSNETIKMLCNAV